MRGYPLKFVSWHVKQSSAWKWLFVAIVSWISQLTIELHDLGQKSWFLWVIIERYSFFIACWGSSAHVTHRSRASSLDWCWGIFCGSYDPACPTHAQPSSKHGLKLANSCGCIQHGFHGTLRWSWPYVSFGLAAVEPGFLLQDDSAIPHRARIISEFLPKVVELDTGLAYARDNSCCPSFLRAWLLHMSTDKC